MIKNEIGGDCRTSVLCCVRGNNTPALPHTIRIGEACSRIMNYPIYGDKASVGLQKRYKRMLDAWSFGQSSQPTSYGRGVGVDEEILRLNDLEGQLVQVNMELLRLQAANDELKME